MTVGISLAFTVKKMYLQDRILVRNLASPEVMGGVNECCVGKTGTITRGHDMKVAQFNCEGKEIKNSRKNTLLHCELSPDTV